VSKYFIAVFYLKEAKNLISFSIAIRS